MRIVGIDPGLQITGYGVIDWVGAARTPGLVDGGVIRLDRKRPMEDRLVELETELDSLVAEYAPDLIAVEQLYAHYAHPRTAILMGHARGVILLVARRRGIEIRQLSANRIKQAMTGYGHADKSQMQKAVAALWKLPKPPEPPDVADALAIALCAGRMSDTRALIMAAGSARKRATPSRRRGG